LGGDCGGDAAQPAFSQGIDATPQTEEAARRKPEIATDPANEVQDIVVTAQRREESLQRVPVSVKALTNETLIAAGVRDLGDIARLAPSVASTTRSRCPAAASRARSSSAGSGNPTSC
jgi:outer membrane receptor protein involved in Fe transport